MKPFNEKTSNGLYRSRRGWFLGVCRGIGESRSIHPNWLRLGFVLFFMFSGWVPAVLLYILAALLLKPEPVLMPANDEEREFYDSYASSRGQALQRMKRLFDQLDRRTRRLESVVTSREYSWERRMGS